MKAGAVSLLALFEQKMRYEVPLFQRRYVWSRTQQWEPLWDDIERKFTEYLGGRKDGPVHFLGAMVLDQKQTPSTHVGKRHVIDGQQRLTTLQIFLAAFRDFCRECDCPELGDECEQFTLNKGMMAEPEVEQFKVWPTQLDRPDFQDVLLSKSRRELERRHPLQKKPRKRSAEPRPRMVEAYLFFSDSLRAFFLGQGDEAPVLGEQPIALRLEECLQALRHALQVVAIDLETGDDPQVIFETLNARGEPLLPADLLRNYIFLRAARMGFSTEALYREYWSDFETDFWRKEIRQGRLLRPRSDLFMQHFLASQQGEDIPIKHLYTEYRHWIETKKPFDGIEAELAMLARYGQFFRRIEAPKSTDALHGLSSFLQRFDVGTAYPVLLHLLDAGLDDQQWIEISSMFESYILRRQVCGLPTKNYNKVFLTLVKLLQLTGPSVKVIYSYFDKMTGESTLWPDDTAFFAAWTTRHAYQTLLPGRLAYLLSQINREMTDNKSERMEIKEDLTIEHLLPQAWVEHWPLPDGSAGLTAEQFYTVPESDPRRLATARRNTLLHNIGNLTLLSDRLNPALSNGPWPAKRDAIKRVSLLSINKPLGDLQTWDETTIEARARLMFELAKRIWPRSSPKSA